MSHRTRCSCDRWCRCCVFSTRFARWSAWKGVFFSSSSRLRSSVFLAAFSVPRSCRATTKVFLSLFLFLTAEETFFSRGKNRKKKVNAHFVNTLKKIRGSLLFVVFMALARWRDDEEGGRVRRDEREEEEEQNAASTKFSDGASTVFFPLLGDVQPRDVEVRCVYFFVAFQSLSLSLSLAAARLAYFFTRI